MTEEIKKIITEAKNIYLIPSEEPESEGMTGALALFYTLKELGKNVNLITDQFPEKFTFLIPSLDFISSPKNFVLSIPRSKANVSQVYYEKNDEHLKIHLTIDQGTIKKEDVSFYFQEAKPDLIITLGIKSFQKELVTKLDSFGFLLDAPILNIDNTEGNEKFGTMNFVNQSSLAEATLDVIKMIDLPNQSNENLIKRNVANCLLAGLIIHYKNFQDTKTPFEVFQLCADLMKQGADRKQISEHLYKPESQNTPFIHTIKS